MERFLIVYRSAPGGATETAAHSEQRWRSWFDSLGSALIDRGSLTHSSVEIATRLAGPKPVDSSLAGYSLVAAADFNAAVKVAEQCPIFDEKALSKSRGWDHADAAGWTLADAQDALCAA